jgi:hypothetical protein
MIEDFQRDGAVLVPGLWADWVDDLSSGIARNMAEPGPMPPKTCAPAKAGAFSTIIATGSASPSSSA